MRTRFIGLLCILAGMGVLAVPFVHSTEERTYVYPPGARGEAYMGIVPSAATDSRLIVNGCAIPHETVRIEVSEADARRMREEAGYSSEGVSGGVIVEFKETGSCPNSGN